MRRRTYSQSGQDVLVEFILKRNDLIPKVGTFRGTYIDVGACHPIDYNNTYYFYEKGWRGVCVEPNPDLAPAFTQYRPEDAFQSCALGDHSGTKVFHRFSNPQWNTFDKNRVSRIQNRYEGRVSYLGAIDIKVRQLQHVINDLALNSIDFLSIDVEGFELQVFNGINLSTSRPKLILFENIISIDTANTNEAVTYLTSNNYKLVAHTGHDAFMIDELASKF